MPEKPEKRLLARQQQTAEEMKTRPPAGSLLYPATHDHNLPRPNQPPQRCRAKLREEKGTLFHDSALSTILRRPTPPPTRSPDSEPRRQLSKISTLRNYTPTHSPSDLDMGTVSMGSINTTISPPMRHKHGHGTQNRRCGVTWVQAAFCQT